ncbi:DNA polymerase family A-domain-containing protein [Dipodascopsis tothii]|uniref:DNA polymerase family A-domain-containing protein n=1 Tax=Dipodascopsis tothii TaxID=44089 RepID=UPI0034CE00B4
MHGLLGKSTDRSPPIEVELPPLEGQTLDEHFTKLGAATGGGYQAKATRFAEVELPARPAADAWLAQSGWTKYVAGRAPERVELPEDDCLVFDVETLYKESPFAVMAVAASDKAWYCWLSPWLMDETENSRQLVPMGTMKAEKVIVGHNVGYDRIRIKDEYNFRMSKAMFIDTMSFHIAVNGMSSQQRPMWKAQKKLEKERDEIMDAITSDELGDMIADYGDSIEEAIPWISKSSMNSLRDVAKLHCDLEIDKEVRDNFAKLDRPKTREMLNELVDYCATDVETTHKVYRKLLPAFLERCPHPVSFAALRHLSSVFLPVDRSWTDYVARAEDIFRQRFEETKARLRTLAAEAVELKDRPAEYEDDPWLSQLDWTIKEIRMTKETKTQPARMVKNQKMPGFPEWYKELFPSKDAPMNISVRTRIAPLLLRMSWEGFPLFWTDKHGWTIRVPHAAAKKFEDSNFTLCDVDDEKKPFFRADTAHKYFKIPHKDGPKARCASPMAKGYVSFFESGVLSSEYPYAREALKMNASCSYWISARERIFNQIPIWAGSDLDDIGVPASSVGGGPAPDAANTVGMILPSIVPMGTITRRAVENTWLTASNAKKDRVGSELKAMVRAPAGYKFVGADVDSEELWIASLVGDSQFGLHGGTAIGWMTLEGTKNEGTDLHSVTAKILSINRNQAKVFNYGRIYGAGMKFAIQLLRQFNPTVTDKDAQKVGTDLYSSTKGSKATTRKKYPTSQFWHGGTESLMFNRLEEISRQHLPRTPVLGAAITEALQQANLTKDASFMTSRINWAIQSSGVDYLHLLIVSMDYLVQKYGIEARLCLSVHDEIRYLVKEKDQYRAAMALQISNIWTRAMFCEQLGIYDIPQSCAFFSAVDIDTVLRKEVDMDCITPSQPVPIQSGESLSIRELLEKDDSALKLPEKIDIIAELDQQIKNLEYTPRTPVFEDMLATQVDLYRQFPSRVSVPSNDQKETADLSRRSSLSWSQCPSQTDSTPSRPKIARNERQWTRRPLIRQPRRVGRLWLRQMRPAPSPRGR